MRTTASLLLLFLAAVVAFLWLAVSGEGEA